jgi:hypothetical protein
VFDVENNNPVKKNKTDNRRSLIRQQYQPIP